ncbi:MAG: tRNA-2-methylthio-N(6)-dimethylallyladenosine synthase [Candidatus Scalindua sp.]|nr:tRNA (N6-isopentenyl adenosine(37)-C2)-methylthiotransferase MiaB [Planctomycetota bacterium]GJQ57748.1 MAG: tRNA-2-methylthio-N(6)-dimethylallyladenosine synthase [Candidatus Scalindua sp.]
MIHNPNREERDSRNVLIKTFGCQMNKLDSELVFGSLIKEGYTLVTDEESADIILFNTCSVRQKAEDKVYSHLGKLRKYKEERPGMVIGVMGCMAQNEGEKILKRMPHVNLICGTRMFSRLPELLDEVNGSKRHILAIDDDATVDFDRSVAQRPNRFHAFVSIMRGCDNYCSYCIVPYVRGREFSRPREDIVNEVKGLADDGCKEVTLLGQNVNSYGKGLGGNGHFSKLLRQLDRIVGIERIRFVTSHPKDMSQDILEAVGELPTVCENLHMPAQSGSDRVLERMRRRYTSTHYRGLIEMAKTLVPDITIAGDFIVGFSGETDEDFLDTENLMRDVRYQNCFIFKYSPRTGTDAEKFVDDVEEETKKRRNHRLLELQEEISTEENSKRIGKSLEVLVEGTSKTDNQKLTGRTRQNHIVVFDFPESGYPVFPRTNGQAGDPSLYIGKLVNVTIEDATDVTLYGSMDSG